MQIPYIKRQEAENFAKNYTIDGVHIIMDSTAIEFAYCFANLALKHHAEVNALLASESIRIAAAEAAKDKPSPKIIL